jgi:polyhydroxybutyrate depolymerase
MQQKLALIACLFWVPYVAAQIGQPTFCGNESSEGFHRIEVNGAVREFILHVPDIEPSDSGFPLLINFHGFGDCAKDYAEVIGEFYGLNGLASEAGFIVAYPQAMVREKGSPYWEPGDIGPDIEINDVMFTRHLVSDVGNKIPVDFGRTFALGYSNGGMMAYDLACSAADLFDSVAIISGVKLDGDCDDSVATSILHFHGLYDDIIPLDGSGDFPSVYDGINFWVEQNRILESTGIVSSLNEGDVMLEQYLGGMESTEVHLYVINSESGKPAGHSWFSADIEGQTPNQIIWSFFSAEGSDNDGDGINDNIDNCPSMANEDQADNDSDGEGDVCDSDDDNDGTNDEDDAFPYDYSESLDTDGDSIGNNEDYDDDADGILDSFDNAPLVVNAIVVDSDNDGVIDSVDAYPNDPNKQYSGSDDLDGDGFSNDEEIDYCTNPFDKGSQPELGGLSLPMIHLITNQ